MSRVSNYVCNVCSATKGQANHWWIFWSHPADKRRQITVAAWDSDLAADGGENVEHICGEACLQKRLAAFTGGNNGN